MKTHSYNFEGQLLKLTEEEIRPFHNNGSDRVTIGALTEFTLKNGEIITGIPQIDPNDYIYPDDGFDVPLQSKFTILEENGNKIVLKFTDIESHVIIPTKGKPLFG